METTALLLVLASTSLTFCMDKPATEAGGGGTRPPKMHIAIDTDPDSLGDVDATATPQDDFDVLIHFKPASDDSPPQCTRVKRSEVEIALSSPLSPMRLAKGQDFPTVPNQNILDRGDKKERGFPAQKVLDALTERRNARILEIKAEIAAAQKAAEELRKIHEEIEGMEDMGIADITKTPSPFSITSAASPAPERRSRSAEPPKGRAVYALEPRRSLLAVLDLQLSDEVSVLRTAADLAGSSK